MKLCKKYSHSQTLYFWNTTAGMLYMHEIYSDFRYSMFETPRPYWNNL
jgi:hypothetical protein